MSLDILKQIAGWKLEAKLENTTRYFYSNFEVSQIEDGSKSYVIGRKGVGKTAISEYIFHEKESNKFAQKLSFKNFPFNDIYDLQDNSFKQPNQYVSFWKLTIYSAIAQMMLENQNLDNETREILEQYYPNRAEKSLTKKIQSWAIGSLELKILGTGFQVKKLDSKPTSTNFSEKIHTIEKLILSGIDTSNYYVLFDELDEDYKDMNIDENYHIYMSLLTGLFKAVQDIKAFSAQNNLNLFPIIFLRDDIYNLIKDPDKNKWRDLMLEINWTSDSIKGLLAYRISRAIDPDSTPLAFGVAWSKVFSDSKIEYGNRQQKSMELFDFITNSTHIRPRDYIFYIQTCAKEAIRRNRNLISSDIVQYVDKEFSNYLRNEIEDEIQGLLPEISTVMTAISHMRLQQFSKSQFEDALKITFPEDSVVRKTEFILEILFNFSVIGNQPKQGNIKFFRYKNKEARFNFGEKICIHRGLFKSLQIY